MKRETWNTIGKKNKCRGDMSEMDRLGENKAVVAEEGLK